MKYLLITAILFSNIANAGALFWWKNKNHNHHHHSESHQENNKPEWADKEVPTASIPEPSTFGLLALATGGIIYLRKRK